MSDDADPRVPQDNAAGGLSSLPADTKLTATKQRWAREGKFLTGRVTRPEEDRLPPGQHLVRDWPVLDLGMQPRVPLERWRLDIDGAIENAVSWDWDTFKAQKQTREVTDIHCVTTWSRYDNRWEGVATRDLLDVVMPKMEATHVMLHSYDGYTTNLALEDFAAEDALVVHSWEGQPLTREHGGPVRLVVPHLYFWKSAKWLKRIEFRTSDKRGFWEENGYHNHADPWKEERYSADE
ncbi:oxidoreductase molybdopterin binding protein [Ancylobacter novellus DSM 506]|uniref:Oxidoreductase molybdopterin binding protein n=1 Tax=Ancylobacter novellus (strain ATCC 8093 / DSM 506 / JCM 20403 / CCM 1077 / IAM 12100 / NBRC 12443 / NCIMB 10456) TaxID=639283 RepID=D7A925_ANCN5|nr:sulfite oxidase-like oxidoreductase [Ancylobacter novellus]ADH88730.1 oxidoreductase molybdopterin binding protein [Ancylobacter novellus DSM 506]